MIYVKIAMAFIKGNWLKWLKNPYIVAALLAVALIATGLFRISYLNKKVVRQATDITMLKFDLENCQAANEVTNLSLDNALVVNKECASQWAEAKLENQRVLYELNNFKGETIEKIKYIEVLKPATECDISLVDNNFAGWMRGEKAVNQD